MLDSHPDLAIPPESYFVTELAEEWPPGAELSWDDFVARLSAHDRFTRWGLPAEALQRDDPPRTFAGAIRCTFAAYAAARGKSRYGDKTPRYVQDVEAIAALLPEAVFVHVIRDGRDVALSFLEREWGPKTIEEAARRWRKRVKSGRRAGSALGSRYLEVRYERLVADPAAELERVCAHLDLEPSSAMLRYFERADDVVAGTKYPEQHASLAAPPTPGLRNWRSDMTSAGVASFEAIAGNLLAELGYERVSTG